MTPPDPPLSEAEERQLSQLIEVDVDRATEEAREGGTP